MEITTSMALCSNSATPRSSHTTCLISEIEYSTRISTSHHAIPKPVVGGLSALLTGLNARHCSPCTSETPDLASVSNSFVRGVQEEWHAVENWAESPSFYSPNCLKIRDWSPVSVLQGPLAYSSGQSCNNRRSNKLFLLDQQLGSPILLCSLSADVQQPFTFKEDFERLQSTSRSCSVGGEPQIDLLDKCLDRSGNPEEGISKGTDPTHIRVTLTAEDILYDAQQQHEIFKDPFIVKAFRMAEKAHHGQFRSSGELYLAHCVETGMLLAAIGASKVVVAAGLLHDTLDDSTVDYCEIQDMFGKHVADLVEGVSRLSEFSKLARDNDTAAKAVEADRLHTMFLAMVDIQVVMIKLADRLHNMRTLGFLPEHKRRRIAKETLQIFTPLANRIGIWTWKSELEDLCFEYLKPQEYQDMARKLVGGSRKNTIKLSIQKLENILLEEGILYDELSGRCKNLYGIYSKMLRKGRNLEEIYDAQGLRLIVANKEDCYAALQVVHKLWPQISEHVKDYIVQPKENGYQSLHTIVQGDDGLPLEIQIRTKEMHHQAEFGVAAHWRYKEDNVEHSPYILQVVEWARWMLRWQREIMESKTLSEFSLRSACSFPHQTQGCAHSQILQTPPQGKDDPLFVIVLEDKKMTVQELPGGSTVADLLDRMSIEDSFTATNGVAFCEETRPKVNHKMVHDIQQVLKMGDLVELTPVISNQTLQVEYNREKIKRMFSDSVVLEKEKRHAVQLSSS